MDSILWNSILRLGTMKAWSIARGAKWMMAVHSAEQLIDEMEKRLLASKAAPSTVTKTIDLAKKEEIEALLFGALNSALPEQTQRFYSALLKRNKVRSFYHLNLRLTFHSFSPTSSQTITKRNSTNCSLR